MKAPLGKYLEENPQIKTIYLGQDADEAGLKSREKCRALLKERQYTGKVIDKLSRCQRTGLQRLERCSQILPGAATYPGAGHGTGPWSGVDAMKPYIHNTEK